MKTDVLLRKDHTGRNTVNKLGYYGNFFVIELKKDYKEMNINERIMVRTSYCGNTYPSLCIRELIGFNNENPK